MLRRSELVHADRDDNQPVTAATLREYYESLAPDDTVNGRVKDKRDRRESKAGRDTGSDGTRRAEARELRPRITPRCRQR